MADRSPNFERQWMESVTPQTTVIVLGDARGNNLDPGADIVRRIAERSKRAGLAQSGGSHDLGLGRFGDAALSDLLQRGPAMRYRPAARARRLGHCGDIS